MSSITLLLLSFKSGFLSESELSFSQLGSKPGSPRDVPVLAPPGAVVTGAWDTQLVSQGT